MKKLTFAVLILIGFSACDNKPDTTSPTIQLQTPTNNQIFNLNTNVKLSGKIEDNRKLSEIYLWVTHVATQKVVLQINSRPNKSTFDIDYMFPVKDSLPGLYRIDIGALDNANNRDTMQVFVKGE